MPSTVPSKTVILRGDKRPGGSPRPFSTHFTRTSSAHHDVGNLLSPTESRLSVIPSRSPTLLRRSNSAGGTKQQQQQSRKMSSAAPPAEPYVRTWIKARTAKKIQALGRVFGSCIDETGGFYLSMMNEKGERAIQHFDSSFEYRGCFHPRASKNGKHFEVFQIVLTPKHTIAAACRTTVTVWSTEGKLLIEHGRNMFKFAKWLAVRSTDEIIVSDTDDDSIKLISPSGQIIDKLSHTFKTPTGVAVDSNDNIIIADWNDRIRIFDSENNLVQTFGTKGSGCGELDFPYGLACDLEDNIVVCDMWNDRISLFARDGSFLRHVIGRGAHECTHVGRPDRKSVV